jgi:hypothetical protein
MLLQAQRAKCAQGVDGNNLLRRPIGEKRDRYRDQSAHKVRVAVAAKVQDRSTAGAISRLALQPDLADAALNFVGAVMGRLAQRLERMTEFDHIAIPVLPIVEESEVVANGLDIGQDSLEQCKRLDHI